MCEEMCVSSVKNLINRKQKRSRKRKLKLRMKELTWEQGTQLRFALLCIRNTGSIRPLLKLKIKIAWVNVLYSGPLWLRDFKTFLLLFSSALLIFFLLQLISLFGVIFFFFFLESCLLQPKPTCLSIYICLYYFIEK